VPVEESEANSSRARIVAAVLLASAAAAPEARGGGAGFALMAPSVAWTRGRGYASMVTDWRTPNVLASRFSTRRGFRPTFVRRHRFVPPVP
jgi:GNAT superfamily N-acetyltransferase